MNDTLDKINKLIELAIADDHAGTPAREAERFSAALMACKLIGKYKIPVGDVIPEKHKEWTAPSPDFYQTVEDLFKDKQTVNPDQSPMDAGPGLVIVDRDLSDENPMRRAIILAWRAIREARQKLQTSIWRYETETGRHFNDRGF